MLHVWFLGKGMMSKQEAFEKMGGRDALIRINKIFYDKVYEHPWLKLYFEAVPQEHIEGQQVDFMQRALGGENLYVGKTPPNAHGHVFITNELFDLRTDLLVASFEEANTHPELIRRWLALDETFRSRLVKTAISECAGRFTTDPVLAFPDPR